MLGWCTSCSDKRQSRAETSAPPEVSSICVNPCNLWEDIPSKWFCEFCEFRGRTYAPNESVSIRAICGRIFPSRSFCEFCEFRGRTYAPNESVSIRAICGRIFPSRRFCEFCEFRGRTYAPSRIRAIRVIRVRFITGIYVCLLHCFIGQ